jgi:hypothetical protein
MDQLRENFVLSEIDLWTCYHKIHVKFEYIPKTIPLELVMLIMSIFSYAFWFNEHTNNIYGLYESYHSSKSCLILQIEYKAHENNFSNLGRETIVCQVV